MAWVIWSVAAGVLMLAELFTLTFVLGLFSIAALVALVTSILGAPVVGQVAAFAGASAVLWWLIKPLERAHRRSPSLVTGSAALTGRRGVVTQEITALSGRVKVGGESWAARAHDRDVVLAEGTHVTVAQVDGVTLVVFPEEI